MMRNERGVVLFSVLLSSFLTPFMGSAVNIALPSIGSSFGMDAVDLNWVVTSFLLASTMFLLPMGKLADLYGRKRVFLIGIVLFTMASLCCGLAGSTSVLLGGRVLQGIGGAMIFATGIAILTTVYAAEERGRVLGLSVSAVYLGLTVGPFLGGALTEHLGWRSIFLALVPAGVAAGICAGGCIKDDRRTREEGAFDLAGAVIYALALPVLIYGLSLLPQNGWLLVALGLTGLIIFILRELAADRPLIDLKLFTGNRVFALSNLAALIHYCASFSQGFLLSLYLQYIKGLSPLVSGLVLIFAPVVMTVMSPVAGRLSDRVEPRLPASAGMLLTALGLGLLSRLTSATPLAYLVITLLISGLGFALFSSPNTNAVMGAVQARDYGVASGILATMRLTGQTLSMAIAMLFFALYLGQVRITPRVFDAFLASTRVTFLTFTVLCLIGTLASLARGSKASP